MSAHWDAAAMGEAMRNGAVACLGKPFGEDVLTEAVEAAVAGQRSDVVRTVPAGAADYGYLQSGASLQLSKGSETQRVHVTGPLHANNGDLLAQGAEADMGIALLPLFIVEKALQEGRLLQVMQAGRRRRSRSTPYTPRAARAFENPRFPGFSGGGVGC